MLNKSFTVLVFLLFSTLAASWMNGVNMPWNHCGNDFGVSFDYNVFNEAFTRYGKAQAGYVRVWVHYDANKQLQLFDQYGYFKTLPN